MMIFRNMALSLALFLLVSACTAVIDLNDQSGFQPVGDVGLTAEIAFEGDYQIESVELRYARHFWPGHEQANSVEAQLIQTQSGTQTWFAAPTGGAFFWKADSLFYEWVVTYRQGEDATIKTGRFGLDANTPFRQVIGCSAGSTQATLDQVRAVMIQLADASGTGIHPAYAASAAHLGPVSLAGQGVPYSHTQTVLGTAVGASGIDPTNVGTAVPPLLLYAPTSGQPTMFTDAEPEASYRLVGAAYGIIHKDAQRRPRMGCIPSENWFVHEAGYHTQDGGFEKTAPNEATPGEVSISNPGGLPPSVILGDPPYVPDPPQPVAAPISSGPAVWHPRLWDIHFWLIGDDQTLILQPDHPEDANGQAFPPGLSVPENTFFFSETFQ